MSCFRPPGSSLNPLMCYLTSKQWKAPDVKGVLGMMRTLLDAGAFDDGDVAVDGKVREAVDAATG